MADQWAKDVFTAFSADADLHDRILDAAHRYQGELPSLLGDIAKYILSMQTTTSTAATSNSKKRKLEDTIEVAQSKTNGATKPSAGITNPTVAFECKNVSFQVPARKKLKLQLVADSSDSRKKEIRLIDPKSEATEYTLSNAQVDQVFCLPVPEKQQRQWNFCVIPQPGAINAEGMPCEQMVFTLNETKADDATSASRPKGEGDTYVTVTEPELDAFVQPYGKHVLKPSDAEFASSIPQSHRKGEKAYHVKAHRGTKEGYLFFLSNGIIFGFKKPLSFFPFSAIESISYTSVLQRTFNLVISATEGTNPEVKDTEFSMLDQADFAGIDEYIKRHSLNDASMAAARKAKAYNVNKVTEGEVEGGELQKAEQQVQDEEDDEEDDGDFEADEESDVAEEYDSDARSEGGEDGYEDGYDDGYDDEGEGEMEDE